MVLILAAIILDLFGARYYELIFHRERRAVECFGSDEDDLCSIYDRLNIFLITNLSEPIAKYFSSGDFSGLLSAIRKTEEGSVKVFGISLKLIPEVYLDKKRAPVEIAIIVVIDWNRVKDKTLEVAINEYLKQL